jgi:hypothetical protein
MVPCLAVTSHQKSGDIARWSTSFFPHRQFGFSFRGVAPACRLAGWPRELPAESGPDCVGDQFLPRAHNPRPRLGRWYVRRCRASRSSCPRGCLPRWTGAESRFGGWSVRVGHSGATWVVRRAAKRFSSSRWALEEDRWRIYGTATAAYSPPRVRTAES